MLTLAQKQTLKADIAANPTLAAKPMTAAGSQEIADFYNVQASPAFTVWKTKVSIEQVGDNIVASELAGLTQVNLTRLQTIVMVSPNGVNPSLADRRAFFDDVFSGAGGQLTRPKLLALWKRLSTVAEKLFSTGTGSDATPATLGFEGALLYSDVQESRELP